MGRRVTPAAFDTGTQPSRPAPRRERGRAASGQTCAAMRRRTGGFRHWGCVVQALIAMLFLLVIVGLCLGSLALYEYYSIASTLPSVSDLQQRASQFETTRILDRNGDLLYEILDPNAGRRTYVTLDKISPALVAATIATEDKDFYNHPGYDVLAIVRALWQNYTSGETVSGASTITQQMARSILLSPGRARAADLSAEGARDHPGGGDHPALFQRSDPGTVPERDLLRQSGLRHRSRGRDLLRHDCRQADAGPGGVPGRTAAVAGGVRYLHQPRCHAGTRPAGADPDAAGQLSRRTASRSATARSPSAWMRRRRRRRPSRCATTTSRRPTSISAIRTG